MNKKIFGMILLLCITTVPCFAQVNSASRLKLSPAGFNTKVVYEWERARHSAGIAGSSWIGKLGDFIIENRGEKTSWNDIILFSPECTNFDYPISLVIFFHDKNEFREEYFREKALKLIPESCEFNLNPVFIFPNMQQIYREIPHRISRVNLDILFDTSIELIQRQLMHVSNVHMKIKQVVLLGEGRGNWVIRRLSIRKSLANITSQKIALMEFGDAHTGFSAWLRSMKGISGTWQQFRRVKLDN